MPKYKYTALDLSNKKVMDVIEARDDADFRRKLRATGLTPVKYNLLDDGRGAYRMKANEAAEFCAQVAGMLSSGITVARAMEILKDRDFKPKLQRVYATIHRDVMQGVTLSEAMQMQPNTFPELLVNMVVSGETSGQLERVLKKMSVHYDKEHRLNGKVKSAMTYPVILLVVTVVVVLVIFIVVLPKFFDLFADIPLPFITSVFLGMSQFLQSYWYLVVIGFLMLMGFVKYLGTIPKIRNQIDSLKLRIPVMGKLLKIIFTARFARTLSSLYTSGISMIQALEITSTIIGNKYIENQFDKVVLNIRNGELLSESIGQVDGFDKKLATTILIGEESGRLDTMLESTAENFDYEAESATLRMVQLVEPIMIVIMALIIGVVMLSVMLPIISLYQNVGNM